ncbi:MAG: DUF1446 domain-containing protein [Alphaproteobacteria bacterium]|nr:DUF1446 domain-containing protein [Alphaproteobacteria bacterium]
MPATSTRTIRIGCGMGFAGDRIDPSVELAERGGLDFLFFEGLAERTLAASHGARSRDPRAGFNPMFRRRMEAVLPGCRAAGTRIITNMGAANPAGAGEAMAALARDGGFQGLRIAVVEGDDVTAALDPGLIAMETGKPLSAVSRRMIAANAYLGGDVIAEALAEGADVVITGRTADPSLVVGPLAHAFGWRFDDWPMLAAGTLVGHLLECSAQITGGYFADPGVKDVPDVAYVGYPLAEVTAAGDAVITKLDRTGGCVTALTCKEQLIYEVHDPAAYKTPDVVADFSRATIDEIAPDRVRVGGARGLQRPDQLKVTVGFDGGLLAEAEISYAGPGAAARARLATAIVRERMTNLHRCTEEIRFDLIGLRALHGTALPATGESSDVRVRAAMRTDDRRIAETLLWEVEALWVAGPAGGGGVRGHITPSVTTQSVLIDRALVTPRITMLTA